MAKLSFGMGYLCVQWSFPAHKKAKRLRKFCVVGLIISVSLCAYVWELFCPFFYPLPYSKHRLQLSLNKQLPPIRERKR